MSLSVETLAVAKKYTKDTIEGVGAIAGKPCQIQSIAPITGGNRITFLWEDNSGVSHTSTMDVMDGEKGDDGLGIKSVAVNSSNHLIVTYDDDTTEDAGEVTLDTSDFVQKSSTAGLLKNDGTVDTNTYVTAVSGKGLSTNDYDNTAKTKLDGLANIKSVGTGLSLNSGTGELTATGGGGTWGSITGTLSDQTDLQTALDGKQATLTFDNVPTNGSNNPVKSDGIYDAINDVYGVMGENGAVNRFKITGTSQTQSDVTCVIDADKGTVKLNGTNNSGAHIVFNLGTFTAKSGEKWNFSGCTGGSLSPYTYALQAYADASNNTYNTDGVSELNPSADVTYNVMLVVWNGTTLSNQMFYPMIAPASYTGDYVPYAQTNQELTKSKMSYADNGILGAKNLLLNDAITQTNGGVTFTVNADKSVTANGTVADSIGSSLLRVTNDSFKELLQKIKADGRDWIFTCCPPNGSDQGYRAHISNVAAIDYGNGIILNSSNITDAVINAHNYAMGSYAKDYVMNNVVFKPMIALASDPLADYDHYVPYAMTNMELTKREVITPTFQTDFSNSNNRTKIIRKGSQIIASFVVLSTGTVTIYDWNNNMLKIEGYGPKTEMFVPFITSDYKTGIVKINPNGMVQLNPSSSFSNQTIFANAVWEINA